MKTDGRYSINNSPEGKYEPQAEAAVLKNLQGIKTLHEIEKIEADQFSIVLNKEIESLTVDHVFTSHDICRWHGEWLKSLYVWAGDYEPMKSIFCRVGYPPYEVPFYPG